MIIFALLLVLFAGAGFAAYCFGVIRAVATFIGLLVSIVVARIFAHSVGPQLTHFGVQNPIYLWLLAPVPPFLISLVIFKIIGLVIQQKVNTYYEKNTSDLKAGLWKRLNPRLGLCVGFANALIYMVLFSTVIYILSYPTVQVASGASDAGWLKLLNAAGHDLQPTGMTKVAGAVDPMPADYYKAADLAGLIYHNDLLEARLARYPAFVALGEDQVFKQIAGNKDFTELRQRQAPVANILNNALMDPIVNSPAMLEKLWLLIGPNLDDIESFLQTGLSQKYADQHLVGRWQINYAAAFSAYEEATPNARSSDMRTAKHEMSLMITNTTELVATLDNDVFLKKIGTLSYITNVITITNPAAARPARGASTISPAAAQGLAVLNWSANTQVFGLGFGGGGGGVGGPPPGPAPTAPKAPPQPLKYNQRVTLAKFDDLQGKWSERGTDEYQIQLSNRQRLQAAVDGDKLTVVGMKYPLVFDREY